MSDQELEGDQKLLAQMMEDAAKKLEWLSGLEEREEQRTEDYLRFGKKILAACGILAFFVVVSTFVAGLSFTRINGAATKAKDTASELQIYAAQNRLLIDRLDKLAREAQINGAKTDLRQCSEIENLKFQIRAVLKSSPSSEDPNRQALRATALKRFAPRDCDDLPNSKIVVP